LGGKGPRKADEKDKIPRAEAGMPWSAIPAILDLVD
jgi:hypothetical protein